jgi:hypothetical protein
VDGEGEDDKTCCVRRNQNKFRQNLENTRDLPRNLMENFVNNTSKTASESREVGIVTVLPGGCNFFFH